VGIRSLRKIDASPANLDELLIRAPATLEIEGVSEARTSASQRLGVRGEGRQVADSARTRMAGQAHARGLVHVLAVALIAAAGATAAAARTALAPGIPRTAYAHGGCGATFSFAAPRAARHATRHHTAPPALSLVELDDGDSDRTQALVMSAGHACYPRSAISPHPTRGDRVDAVRVWSAHHLRAPPRAARHD
jgi:hypothetical protein